jgi:hypothetical protein
VCNYHDIEQAVPGNLAQHVVEKTDSRLHLRIARAIQIDSGTDLCLIRFSYNFSKPNSR